MKDLTIRFSLSQGHHKILLYGLHAVLQHYLGEFLQLWRQAPNGNQFDTFHD